MEMASDVLGHGTDFLEPYMLFSIFFEIHSTVLSGYCQLCVQESITPGRVWGTILVQGFNSVHPYARQMSHLLYDGSGPSLLLSSAP